MHLIGATDGGKTASDVYATWETVAGLSAEYSFDFSSTLPYRKGQVLSNEGKYKIKLTDELGNFKQVEFEIDRTLDFTIFKGTQIVEIEDIRYSNQNILIRNDEDLNIVYNACSICFWHGAYRRTWTSVHDTSEIGRASCRERV